jgi:rhodanese-related sulfurtransferase/membrane protein insertase Oxa1/YidC/SpoIIIJ/phosphohistidine swiveling domain-containing protein
MCTFDHEQDHVIPVPLTNSHSRAQALPAPLALLLGLLVSGLVLAPDALAIPSPDVVIGLFASVAQALGLLSVIAGGWLWKRRGSGGSERGTKAWRIACLASLGLLVLTAVGWGLFAAAQADQRAQRLHTNLVRNSKEDGKKITDVSLKELAFSDQLQRGDGTATETLAFQIETGTQPPILDVRESEEYEMGMVQGAAHARFPDVLADPGRYLDRNKTTLLLCYNGNRSSEMVTALREMGYECRFMIGGYEKWLAEERPLVGCGRREVGDLRQVPNYENRDVLLDTPDVLALMEAGPVQFLDVRYPGEFEGLGHLPGAINLPFRKLKSEDLEAALRAVPRKPIVIACYDKRSSFYGLVTGLRLSRLGYTYLGRYSTPETFPSLAKDKPHVAAWKARHAERTLLSTASAPLAAWIGALAERWGSLALAILVAALALRLLVLPLTLRTDRDRVVQFGLADELARIEREHAQDLAERSQRTLELLHRHGIRPVLGVVSGVVQLVLFSLFFGAVVAAAGATEGGWLWIERLAEPDPRFVLPAVCGVLAGIIALRAGARATRKRWILSLVFGIAVTALLARLAASAGLYLCVSLGFVALQGECVRAWVLLRPRLLARRRRDRAQAARVVPLQLAHLAGDCGNKAGRLAQLRELGFRVPQGFVLRPVVIRDRLANGGWSPADRAAIEAALAQLGAERVAVRSSGAKEDGEQRSFAGVFESVLDVRPGQVFEALERVLHSFSSERARSYSGEAQHSAAILVQEMVPAEYAGVLFTEHPAQTGAALVELVEGLGDELVSGRSEPVSVRLGRLSGRALDEQRCRIPLAELHRIGLRLEQVFGRAQDIEWAFAKGRFFVLQSRDITRDPAAGDDQRARRERERRRLLMLARQRLASLAGTDPQAEFLVHDELADLLPEPRPASVSLLNAISARGGSTDLACRELGLRYEAHPDSGPVVLGVFGRCYSIAGERSRRLSAKTSLLAGFRLGRGGLEIERALREEFLPGHARALRLEEALDLGRLELGELVELQSRIVQRFLGESYREAERVNLAADYYMREAVRQCEKHALDPAGQLAFMPASMAHDALNVLARVGRGEVPPEAFLQIYGHRADHDYELAEPRYREAPEHVAQLARRAELSKSQGPAPALPPGKVLRLSIERARSFQTLKEEAKHAALRDLASLRRVLLEIGARLDVGEGIFQLTLGEIAGIGRTGLEPENLRELVRERQEQNAALEGLRLPARLSVAELETLDLEHGEVLLQRSRETALSGTRVSGEGDVIGRARVLAGPDEIESFRRGEVLVARFTDPAWMPVFPMARGLVMEVGGWLSHAAIQARECSLTCIVGVDGARDSIRSGDLLHLHRDGRVERLSNRRREERVPQERPVSLERLEEIREARLLDLSAHGAQVVLQSGVLRIGERLVLRGLHERDSLHALVARNGTPGNYGLSFEEAAASEELAPLS